MEAGSKKKKRTISGAFGSASTQKGKMNTVQDNSKRRSKLKPRGKRWRIQGGREISWQRTARRGEMRDWAAMPGDALSAIFERLGAMNILLSAQFVCRSWQKAAHDPRVWRCADFSTGYWDVFDIDVGGPFDEMVKAAIDRSKGLIEEFSIDHAAVNEIMLYMARRSKTLKRLELIHCVYFSDLGLVEVLKLCPQLEDLTIVHPSSLGDDLFQNDLNRHCPPLLKRFCLNTRGGCRNFLISNRQARCIARNMPHLRELQLFGNSLSNKGLRAILDGCPHLETLDLRLSFNVDLSDEDIKRRCRGIKKLRGPDDSTEDYPHDADIYDAEGEAEDTEDGEYDWDLL